MPIAPDPPFPKTQGDNIRSKDWNDLVTEVQRLDTAKLNRLGGGPVGIGTASPNRALTIEGAGNAFANVRTTGGTIEILTGVDGNGGIVSTMTNHDMQLRAGGNDTKMILKASGNVGVGTLNPGVKLEVGGDARVNGELQIPKAAGGFAAFSNGTRTNESTFVANNLKLRMGSAGGFIIVGAPPLTYQFIIGHDFFSLGPSVGTSFVRRFSIDQDGNAFFGGSKGGYIIDYFINAVGDTLEQGDVVVLGKREPAGHYGSNNDIPIPEVDLTDRAYDTRVCGVVANFVPAQDLPAVDPKPDATAEDLSRHPLQQFGGPPEGQPRTEVHDQQMGRMVTLGAWGYCKVDADIAPIGPGDLLTTSPTRGHAQKVTDRRDALGAILGKAMGSLSSGKGKIPVLVMLQ